MERVNNELGKTYAHCGKVYNSLTSIMHQELNDFIERRGRFPAAVKWQRNTGTTNGVYLIHEISMTKDCLVNVRTCHRIRYRSVMQIYLLSVLV
jgi:hypothetical protein